MILLISFIPATLLLWFLFINVMYLKSKVDKMPMIIKVPAYIFGGLAFLFDVLFNVVYGTIFAVELPDFKGAHVKYLPTFSERLKDILQGKGKAPVYGIRWKMAYFMCKYMIEPWDKNHCGLEELK